MSSKQARSEERAEHWIGAALAAHERGLTLYALRLLGDIERARDAVGETFLRLCKQPRDDVEHRLAEWLYTVCRNQALDVLRKEGRMSTLPAENAADIQSADEPHTAAIERRECASRVMDAMEALPNNQRDALLLKFQQGLSYKEIARVTEETVGNVGWLIHTGLKKLRDRLGDEAWKGIEA
ncbi:MAG: RNA polymerase subunit sigma-24 [Planctomycetes bacterium]|jgi:RNA polymerase sigma-70 factor (ECF subfamily)|nr:RNA polymerase subunit sigma-24 [Planctomycetota bacterium]MDP6408459.1 sigma-70 family RNA polymerase sigma factor [Planctomycetota bacterium]